MYKSEHDNTVHALKSQQASLTKEVTLVKLNRLTSGKSCFMKKKPRLQNREDQILSNVKSCKTDLEACKRECDDAVHSLKLQQANLTEKVTLCQAKLDNWNFLFHDEPTNIKDKVDKLSSAC